MACNWVPRLRVSQGKNPDMTVGAVVEFHTEIQSAPQIVRNPQNPMSQMANFWRKRDISNLQASQAQNWTNWLKAVVPPNAEENNLESRGQGQVGFICTNKGSAFPDKARHCGIYEWRAEGSSPSTHLCCLSWKHVQG